jgi:hypothetical protein
MHGSSAQAASVARECASQVSTSHWKSWPGDKNLRLVREDGTVVPLQPAGRIRCSLPTGATGEVRLNYEADLSFTHRLILRRGSYYSS